MLRAQGAQRWRKDGLSGGLKITYHIKCGQLWICRLSFCQVPPYMQGEGGKTACLVGAGQRAYGISRSDATSDVLDPNICVTGRCTRTHRARAERQPTSRSWPAGRQCRWRTPPGAPAPPSSAASRWARSVDIGFTGGICSNCRSCGGGRRGVHPLRRRRPHQRGSNVENAICRLNSWKPRSEAQTDV